MNDRSSVSADLGTFDLISNLNNANNFRKSNFDRHDVRRFTRHLSTADDEEEEEIEDDEMNEPRHSPSQATSHAASLQGRMTGKRQKEGEGSR